MSTSYDPTKGEKCCIGPDGTGKYMKRPWIKYTRYFSCICADLSRNNTLEDRLNSYLSAMKRRALHYSPQSRPMKFHEMHHGYCIQSQSNILSIEQNAVFGLPDFGGIILSLLRNRLKFGSIIWAPILINPYMGLLKFITPSR